MKTLALLLVACGGPLVPGPVACHTEPVSNGQVCCIEEAGEWNRCTGTQRWSCEPTGPDLPDGGYFWFFNGSCAP